MQRYPAAARYSKGFPNSVTCINDRGPRFDIDAGSRLPGPEDPHERLSGEDAGCFAHLWHTTQSTDVVV